MSVSLAVAPYSPGALERWIERWGGWCVAAAMHAVLLISLLGTPRAPIAPRPGATGPPTLRVALAPPEPARAPAQPSPPAVSTVAATAAVVERPEPEPELEAAAPVSATAPLEPSRGGLPAIPENLVRRIEDERRALDASRVEQSETRRRVDSALRRLEAASMSRAYFVDTDGGKEGAVRTFDFSGLPEEVVEEVFARYGISHRFEAGPSPPGSDRKSFLNAAVADDGVYRNVKADGPREVLEMTPKAFRVMSRLELEGLRARGFDPDRARVREVVFGIARNAAGVWDLSVLRMQVEDLDGAPRTP